MDEVYAHPFSDLASPVKQGRSDTIDETQTRNWCCQVAKLFYSNKQIETNGQYLRSHTIRILPMSKLAILGSKLAHLGLCLMMLSGI